MSKVYLQTYSWGDSIAAGATNYFPIGCIGHRYGETTEADAAIRYRTAGTFTNLWFYAGSNGTSSASTLKTRKDETDGNLSISIGSGATGEFSDNSNSDVVSAGEDWDYQMINGGGGTIGFRTISCAFESATEGSSTIRAGVKNETTMTFGGASTTYFLDPIGAGDNQTSSESDVAITYNYGGTLSNLCLNVSSNARADSATVFTTRINSANGNLTVSVSASATGIFEDTANSDVIAVRDVVNYTVVTGAGTQDLVCESIVYDFTTTNGTMVYASGAIRNLDASETTYFAFGGAMYESATEANATNQIPMGLVLSKLQCNLVTNGVSATSTLRSRIESQYGNLTVSITASTTGAFSDATNEDIIQPGDYHFIFEAGGSGTTLDVANISINADDSIQAPVLFSGDGYQSFTASQVKYHGLGLNSSISNTNDDTKRAVVHPSPGILSLMYCYVATNDRAESTMQMRSTSASTNLVISVTGSTTGFFQDTTNEDVVSVGDDFHIRFTAGTGGTALEVYMMGAVFTPDAHTTGLYVGCELNPTSDSTTYAGGFAGYGSLTAGGTVADYATIFQTAGRLDHLFIKPDTNSRSTASTYKSNINTGDGNLTISIGGAVTGHLEDTTNFDIIAIDDVVGWKLVTSTGGGAFFAGSEGVQFTSRNRKQMYICGRSSLATLLTGITVYYAFSGNFGNYTTEAFKRVDSPLNFSSSFLTSNIVTNTISATSTVRLRKNGGNANQVLSITASTSGIYVDSVNNDDIAKNDIINYSFVTGATGTNLTLATISVLGTVNWAWGQEDSRDELADSWAKWSDGAGGSPTITGDSDWGKIQLGIGAIAHSDVRDAGDTTVKLISVTPNKYGVGTGTHIISVRGQATTFTQDAGSPSWEVYTTPVTKSWRFMQIKLEGSTP